MGVIDIERNPITTKRVKNFLKLRFIRVGPHEGVELPDRSRCAAAIIDFSCTEADADEHLTESAHSKLRAMWKLQGSPNDLDRSNYREWRQAVAAKAASLVTEYPVVAYANKTAQALVQTNAHPAAVDALVAITVASEQIERVS